MVVSVQFILYGLQCHSLWVYYVCFDGNEYSIIIIALVKFGLLLKIERFYLSEKFICRKCVSGLNIGSTFYKSLASRR